MKKPFDIKYRQQIENGEYQVETAVGYPARIVCWDVEGSYEPIVYLFMHPNGCESVCTCNRHGRVANKQFLFVVVPDEMDEFRRHLALILDAYNGLEIDVPAAVEANAGTLFNIAKKEIEKNILPRWRLSTKNISGTSVLTRLGEKDFVLGTEAFRGEYYLTLEDLESIPKE